MNGSERVPEGVRIPRSDVRQRVIAASQIPAASGDADFDALATRSLLRAMDRIVPDHAINDEQDEYAEHRRIARLVDRFHDFEIYATATHRGVLLTEDAAMAVLDRLEGK